MTDPRREIRQIAKEERFIVSGTLFLGLFLVIGLPVALMAVWSLSDRWSYPDLLPENVTLDRWHDVLDGAGLQPALLNSLVISSAVTVLTALIALPTAWAMAKFRMPGKRALEMFILAPSIIPGIVVGVSVGQVLLTFGLAYSLPGVVLVQTIGTLPLMIRLMIASFEALPDELIHAARSLGAGARGMIIHVVLPLSAPGLMAGGLLSFVSSFEEFDKTFITGAPVIQTLPIKLYTYLDPYSLQFPLAAIVSLILLLPVLVVFVLAGRIMRDDVLASGMGKV
ncbi:multiple sugar transport system permease protein/putative spermidine/putrescine transport system permease protein [Ciceribacter lividus]|uniref:Multiple sugar transport system permease protein/putative spermidine/putrescine transport system permease protein n=1 Tax=Ciceribacter lividus TaxID=1197950 RepID=A0A6I7HL72_9HYPH|nr:ABC transporter permease [Ciceribacter lividus]RCW22641.1 multiple sugar transport system permease protein/putative spermidine/putrescine transport system permease protein [Ciceribacter lividus]